MHMRLGKIEKNFGRLRILSILVFLPLAAPLCHAQCYDGPQGTPQVSLSQNYFAPGHTYNVVLTNPPGYFGSNGGPLAGMPQNFYVVTAASYAAGLLYDEDPYVTVSNEVLVSPTTITVTIAVAANAPTENDAWALWCYGAVYQGPGSVSITPCAVAVTPTITSIQPTAFFAGASTPITITGTGFVPTNNANSCYPTTPSITAGSENVVLSNVNVVSPTEITLAAAPEGSDPLEAASVTAANYSLNGPPYFLNSNAEPAGILPVPTIQWNNNPISGAKTQNAVVGQPINLTTTPTAVTLAAMFPFWQSTWVVGGTNIASYSPTTGATVAPAPTVLTNTTLNTYWVFGGNPLTVTYKYCVNTPGLTCSSNATATFDVSGQGTAKMTVTDYGATKNKNGNLNNAATIDYLYMPPSCTSSDEAPFMVYGNLSGVGPLCLDFGTPTGTAGMAFAASGASPNGEYSYVQTISTESITYTAASGNCTYTFTPSPGLDTSYPYALGNSTNDSPPIGLTLPNSSASRTFVATMYLLWKSTSATNPIWVPLGYQQWQFQASTTNPGAPSQLSWTTPTVQAHGPIGKFISATSASPNYGYPTWGGLSTPGSCSN